MSNILRTEKKLAVLNALVEGCSVRSTERLTGVHRDTICRLLVSVGNGCSSLLDEKMVDLNCQRLEMDELWSYVSKKQRQVRKTDDESMSMRRFTRLTNGYSKKLENHVAAVALHLAHYNFVRRHSTLRVTPAMAAGVETRMWSMGELLDAAEAS